MKTSTIRVLGLFLAFVAQAVSKKDVCEQFPYLSACKLLKEQEEKTGGGSSSPGKEEDESLYCQNACEEDRSYLYEEICHCRSALNTTLAPIITTTGPPTSVCYYSKNRPVQLGLDSSHSRRKRILEGTPVEECQYPGIVGVIFNAGSSLQRSVGTGLLLDEDTLLIASPAISFVDTVKRRKEFHLNALIGTYDTSTLSENSPRIRANTAVYLDQVRRNRKKALYTIKLETPVSFDNNCNQPVCVPNEHVTADDIDLNDCRIVGYGTVDDNMQRPIVSTLMETDVVVDPGSVMEDELKFARKVKPDKLSPLGPCMGDTGSPLICTHKLTKEWIVIGVTDHISSACTTAKPSKSTVKNILNRSLKHSFYTSLQSFKYVAPSAA